MNVLFLSYRSWANTALKQVGKHPRIKTSIFLETTEQLNNAALENFDILITLGWSEELGESVCSRIPAIGLHCAELDRYSYGSPIQLQILDGITVTKHRIFPFVWDPESSRAHTHNRQYSHETLLSLHGDMDAIFDQLTSTSVALLNNFLDDYPNITWREWPIESIVRKKRTPKDSEISREMLFTMPTRKLYDLIRCLGSPYPNAFLEDEDGVLYFEKVRYASKK